METVAIVIGSIAVLWGMVNLLGGSASKAEWSAIAALFMLAVALTASGTARVLALIMSALAAVVGPSNLMRAYLMRLIFLHSSKQLIPGPSLIVTSLAAITYLISALPLLLAVRVSGLEIPGLNWVPRTGAGWPIWIAILGGALVSAQIALTARIMRKHNRHIRQMKRLGDNARFVVTFVIAAGPAGAWLADIWLSTPVLYRAGGATLVALSLGGWASRAALRTSWCTRFRSMIWLTSRLLSALDFILLRHGLLGVLVAVVFHPRPQLVSAAAAAAAAAAAPLVWGGLKGRYGAVWDLDVSWLLAQPQGVRFMAWRAWAHDALVAPRKPDDSLLRVMVTRAVIGVAGQPRSIGRLAALDGLKGGAGVEPLLELVDEGLCVVERLVLPELTGTKRTAVARRVESIRAGASAARAQAAFHRGRYDEAFAEIADGAARMRRMGLPNAACLSVVNLLAASVFQGEGGSSLHAEVVRMAEDPALTATIRRVLMLAATLSAAWREDDDEAARLYRRAQAIRPERRDRAVLLAELRAEQGRWRPSWAFHLDLQALKLLESNLSGMAEQNVEGHPFMPQLGMTNTLQDLLEQGRFAVRLGLHAMGAALLQAAAEEAKSRGHPYTQFDATYWLAVAQSKTDPRAAFRSLSAAMDIYDLFRAGFVDPAEQRWLGALSLAHLDALSLVTKHEGVTEHPAMTAFELSERARARGMLEMLGSVVPQPSGADELVMQERQASTDYATTLKELEAAVGEERVHALARVRAAHNLLNKRWREMMLSGGVSAEFAALRQAKPVSYEQACDLLVSMAADRGIVAFEYHMTGDADMVLLIIRPDLPEPQVLSIPVDHSAIHRAVLATSWSGRLDLHPMEELLQPLLTPILEWSKPGDIICIAPYGAMHRVPMHALSVRGQLLLARNPICYTPSLSVLQHCNAKRTGRRERALILADSVTDRPLPHTRLQAVAITELFNEAFTRVGLEASVSALHERLDSAPPVDVVHLGCHGEFHEQAPLRSGIILSDGLLAVGSLMGLQMQADLVTFSACESGVSENEPGEELIGLIRAAIYAGTPSVVATLWSVEEIATSILIRHFYERLRAGEDKVDALRRAQVSTCTVTCEQVIAYCLDVSGRLTGPDTADLWILTRDIADIRFRARDFVGALSDYQVAAQAAPAAAHVELQLAQARCRRAMRSPAPVDYGLHPFEHPYYWAGFVLIGDWR